MFVDETRAVKSQHIFIVMQISIRWLFLLPRMRGQEMLVLGHQLVDEGELSLTLVSHAL